MHKFTSLFCTIYGSCVCRAFNYDTFLRRINLFAWFNKNRIKNEKEFLKLQKNYEQLKAESEAHKQEAINFKAESEAYKQEAINYKTLVAYYFELIRLNNRKIFGKKKESIEISDINIFNEAENTADKNISEYKIEEIEKYHKIKKKGAPLPKKEVHHDFSVEEKICADCGR